MSGQDRSGSGEHVLHRSRTVAHAQEFELLQQFWELLSEKERNIFLLWSGLGDTCPYDCTQIAEIYASSADEIELIVNELRKQLTERGIVKLLPRF